jgi:hypothetical protein
MQQERLLAVKSCLSLPAPLALALLDAAARIREHLTWTPPTRQFVARLRKLLAVCTNYTFFCIEEFGVRCLTQDQTVDRPSGQIWLLKSKRQSKSKRRQRRNAADKPILVVPITANSALADLVEWCYTQRVAYCANSNNNPPPTAVWSFAPYENHGVWQVATTLSAWLLDAYTAIGATSP